MNTAATFPRRAAGFVGLLAALTLVSASAAPADPLLERIRAEAREISPEDFAVTRIYTDNSGKTRHRLAEFDPRQPEGERWRLLERNHSDPSADYKQQYEENDRPPPDSYARVSRFLAGELRRAAKTETHVIYALDSFGEGSILFEDEDISAHFAGEIRVNVAAERPFVEEVRFHVVDSFKPHFLAKIKEGEGVIRFARDASGRPVALLREFTVRGSKLFGSLEYSESSRYRDHRFVGRAAAAVEEDTDGAKSDSEGS